MVTLFIVSLIGICLLLGFKIFEAKVMKIESVARLSHRGDAWIREMADKAIYSYNRGKKIGRIFLFDFLPSYAYEILVKLKDYVSKKYYAAGNDFRGRRVLRSNGSVSFFLQRITEEAGEVEGKKA
jgi:hypothetical protein